MSEQPPSAELKIPTTGLILSGGGARAAYQVGVLRAISDLLPRQIRQPFKVISGTSAGAINALGLAGRPGSFRSRTRALTTMWASLTSESIYETHLWAVTKNALEILRASLSSSYATEHALALLDNQPLCELLTDIVQFTHIEEAIAAGEIDAISVTALNYSNGRSTTFFQGREGLNPWVGSGGIGIRTELGVPHLMASSAIPTLFPARRIGDNYFGDGALRQTRPLSAPINLGAQRLMIIGVSERHLKINKPEPEEVVPPSIPQVLGQLLNAVFLDAVNSDLETLDRINSLIDHVPSNVGQQTGLQKIETLMISPSTSLAAIAREHINSLPRSMRWFLSATGSIKESGSGGALSYILFERAYCQQLIELGYQDAMRQKEEILHFFHSEEQRAASTGDRSLWQVAGPVVKRPLNPLTKAWFNLIGKRERRV